MPNEAICSAPFELNWRQYRDAPLGQRQVRVTSEFAAAKHGTELAIYGGAVTTRGHFDESLRVFHAGEPESVLPIGIGNMLVGRVTELGGEVERLKLGDRVLA